MSSLNANSGNVTVDVTATYNLNEITFNDGDPTELQSDINGNLKVVGNRAHDAVDAGNPHKIGGHARAAEPAAVADDDRVDAYFDLNGRLVVKLDSATDFATETTLALSLAELQSANTMISSIDSNLASAEALLQSIEAKDFATETTLAAAAASLASIEAEDFATETSLAQAVLTLSDILASAQATAFESETIRQELLKGRHVRDMIDDAIGPVLDCSANNIQDNAGAFLEVVASLASEARAIRVADTTGQFIGVYVGGAGLESLAFIINPGQSNEINHRIPVGSRVSVRSMGTEDIVEGLLCLQFMGSVV